MDSVTLSADTIVDFLESIFRRRGAEAYIGEKVTMAEHMLQAAHLAEQENAGDLLIAAALLHDIGHFTSEFGENAADEGIDNLHEEAGATVLKNYFPPEVTEPVRCHVETKRYLCATDPNYFETLSAASVHSLQLQGGPMTADEVIEFEANPHLQACVRVRRWDEMAKVEGMTTPSFDHYKPVLQRALLDTA